MPGERDFNTNLSPEEARGELETAKERFEELKTKYTKGLRRFQFWLSGNDLNKLYDLMYDILKISASRSYHTRDEKDESLYKKAIELNVEIGDMMAGFINTKTKRAHKKSFWRRIRDYSSEF